MSGQVTGGKQRQFTGRHMLLSMIAFFGVITGVNLWLVYEAGNSWTGLMAKNGYAPSQNFNAELARARIQKARGWQAGLGYENGSLQFTLAGRSGGAVVLDGMTVTVGRPAFDREDREVPLIHLGNGLYRADLQLAPGAWDVRVEGGSGDRTFRRESRLHVAAGTGREE